MVLDQNTFQVLHSHEFAPFECAVSVLSGEFANDPQTYYIVGTGMVYRDEQETKVGRLIVFEVDDVDKTKLKRVHETNVRGCPHALRILNGKLAAAINSSIRLFEWTDREFRLECSNYNNIVAVDLKVMNEEVAVADVMRSVSLLSYRQMEGSFEEVAKDWNSNWMITCEFITAESILGSEAHLNLFTVEVDKSRPITDDGRYVLEPTGYFYLGEIAKVMVRSSLVPPPEDSTIQYTHPIMFGTTQGSIGMIVQIDDKWKKFLVAVEKAIADSNKNCMHIEHSNYRTFVFQKRAEPVCQTDLPSKIVPRSIVATCIEEVHYLLVALGDGTLIYYVFDVTTGRHGEAKKSSVGTRPPSLHRVRSKNRQHLFVCSDRPVIIFSVSKKLVFSNVNVKLVNTVCSLSSNAYRDCLVISDGKSMVFGTVDDIQKIHVRSIPMGESVSRIAYQKSTGTYGVCSARKEDDRRTDRVSIGAFSEFP
uniref:Damage-specific DNA-binding protein 1 n=1 Tax=Caenorhabditis japonica TaxID=281687 RepID=A0A8R1EJM5_CAEJA